MFNNWRKNKQKKANKPRAAPQAHRHPQYIPNAPRPPAVSARPVNPTRNKAQTQPKYNPRPQPQHIKQRSHEATPQKPPQKQQPPDDDDSDDDMDMFADMDLNQEEDDDDATDAQTKHKQSMSVEELNKLSEEQQITLALRMSIAAGTPSAPSKAEQTESIASLSPNTTHKAPPITQQQPPQPIVDKGNIEWPSIPDNNNTEPQSEPSSAFGFVLNDKKEDEEANKSAFGFDLGGTEEPQTEATVVNAEEDTISGFESMSVNTEQHKEAPGVIRSPSYTSSQASPPPSTSLGPQPTAESVSPNQSVLSQLKRAEQQHERTRKRIWSQIRSCIEREQRIKGRESDLNDKLIAENNKRKEAEDAKKIALSNADFEEAEKSKNVIRRSLKNIQDIEHQLSKISVDIKRIKGDKASQEQVYMSKNKHYKDKLDVLYRKHEESMTQRIGDEFNRIEKEEKKYKEKLDRTEREIQLDEENIERTKDRLEEIEDLIKNDVKPFQDNLDKKEQDKSVLELEIDELNKQLIIKKKELLTVENGINDLQIEIDSVRSEYKSQMDEITEEQSRYEKSRSEFNLQKNDYLIKLNGLNCDNEQNREIETAFEDELNSLKLKMSKINESFERFEEREIRASEWRTEEERLLNEEKKLNKSLADILYEIEKLEKELKQIESKCIQHRQVIATIDCALPILHSDKTTAVNNENYLEAGKIHKTLQNKEQQKDNSLKVLKELNIKRNVIKDNLIKKETQIKQQIKKELKDIKIKIDKQRFELIMDHENNIKQTLQDLNDIKVNDDDVEKIVLKLELNQLQNELIYFNDKYGWDHDQFNKKIIENEILNNAEEETVQEKEIIKEKTKKQIQDEINDIKNEIKERIENKEEIQNDINGAVANDDYETAGKLAPKKKKLISQINELNIKLEMKQFELKQAIDNENENDDEDIANDSNDIDGINETEQKNDGLNGIVNHNAIKEENDNDNDDDDDDDDVVEDNNNEDAVDDDNDGVNDSDDGDAEGENMFGNMAVVDDESDNNNDNDDNGDDQHDTVNID